MENEKIYLTSEAIDLSEEDDKPYIVLTNRLCYYGEPNLNGVVLPVDKAQEKAATLIDMPVQAKYKKVKMNGKVLDDLGGHEAYKDPVTQEVSFGTESIGTHIAVEIKDDTVEIDGVSKTLPCLFAKAKIWKRNKKVIGAIKRLFDSGLLHSSWEIATKSYTFKNGIKTLTDYYFLGNALLGSTTPGAYPCATALSMSSLEQSSLEIAEALSEDIYKEDEMKKAENEAVVSEEVSAVEPTEQEKPEEKTDQEKESEKKDEPESKEIKEDDESKTEISALSDRDLRMAIEKACCEKVDNYCWIALWFPNEKVVWVKNCKMLDTEFLAFKYEANNDVVTVGEPVKETLVVNIPEINNVVAAKDDALVKANETVKELQSSINELAPYKAQVEKERADKEAKELAEKQESLKSYAIKSNLISEEECNSGDIHTMISELDEAGIKNIIATRFMDSLNSEVKTSEVNTSEKSDDGVIVSSRLEDDEEQITLNPIKAFLE